jgi:hypothetical protein
MVAFPTTAKFSLGKVVATPNAVATIPRDQIIQALRRHQSGDWGTVCPEDQRANDDALVDGSRILSVYFVPHGLKFWIITEADRSITTILLPEDY